MFTRRPHARAENGRRRYGRRDDWTNDMAHDDKIKNKTQQATGKGKEVVGEATDDESMKNEGKSDQAKAKTKQAAEHAKDSARSARDAFKK